MLGMSSPLRICCGVAGLLVVLAACSGGEQPTVVQAGQNLRSHILQLLKERNAQHITVTDSGGRNIPCADGRVKQTFAATGQDVPKRTPDALVDALLGALPRVAPYEIVSAGEPGAPVRVRNLKTQTFLVLSAPASGEYAVNGETACLMAG